MHWTLRDGSVGCFSSDATRLYRLVSPHRTLLTLTYCTPGRSVRPSDAVLAELAAIASEFDAADGSGWLLALTGRGWRLSLATGSSGTAPHGVDLGAGTDVARAATAARQLLRAVPAAPSRLAVLAW